MQKKGLFVCNVSSENKDKQWISTNKYIEYDQLYIHSKNYDLFRNIS